MERQRKTGGARDAVRLTAARTAWRKMSNEQRVEFLSWLAEAGALYSHYDAIDQTFNIYRLRIKGRYQ